MKDKKAFLESRSNRRSTTLYKLTKSVKLASRFLENFEKKIFNIFFLSYS